MKDQIKRLWRDHPRILSGFVLASVITLFFVVRILVSVVYWSNPEHHNMQVQPWMTVGYIARSWGLEGPQIDQIAGLPLPQGHPLTLIEIARERGVPVADVVKKVEDAVMLLVARRALAR